MRHFLLLAPIVVFWMNCAGKMSISPTIELNCAPSAGKPKMRKSKNYALATKPAPGAGGGDAEVGG